MSDYFNYYGRTLHSHTEGLKLVGGGTGLGKTSIIPRIVEELLSRGRKGIYFANRLQLTEEMVEGMKKRQLQDACVMLPRDSECVRLTLKDHRSAFETLISSYLFQGYAQATRVDVAKLRRTYTMLLETYRSTDWRPPLKWQEETLESYTRSLLRDIRTVVASSKENSDDHIKFLDDEAVQSLFPFIAFLRRPKARLLSVSLHKLFYGFFDGQKTLTASDLKGYVMFADEFDFLERDLIGLIATASQIDDPFHFVGYFYNEIQRHKRPLENYPISASDSVRKHIDRIMSLIERMQGTGINYPSINQFTNTENQQDVVIFRTSHTVSSKPLYLMQTERAFDITSQESQTSLSAFRLLSTITNASEQILALFKSLETDDLRTYQGLLQDCYHTTVFATQIGHMGRFPHRRAAQSTQLGSLLDHGYNMFDIHDMNKATDPEQVELRHYAIYTTPEQFIATLSRQNLVFALSATADIERCVNHFSLEWLRSREDVTVLPINDADKEDVERLTAEKAAMRNNNIFVIKLSDMGTSNQIEKELKRFINTLGKLDGIDDQTQEGYRKRRIERFFMALLRTMDHQYPEGELETHLMFLNTYKQIEYVFATESTQQSTFYQITQRMNLELFQAYDLVFQSKPFIVVFYNAEKAKNIRSNDKGQKEFQALFTEDRPVVVVTQYASAGNGVNLQYRLPDGRERDFLNLHLLEVPYYYFSDPSEEDTPEQRVAKHKENIWYLAKLHAAKYLSENEFKIKLGTLHHPRDWNTAYKDHVRMSADYRRNTLAALIQALGRIERVREVIPDQHVILCREAYQTFQHFLAPEYETFWSVRAPMMSHNLRQLLEQIRQQTKRQERDILRKEVFGLSMVEQSCKQAIKSSLEQFSAVRSGHDSITASLWRELRLAALKHDFADQRLINVHAVHQSEYFQDGVLCITPEQSLIPATLAQPNTWRWRLNLAYDRIGSNTTIRKHFAARGYELDFTLGRPYFFVPYFYQAVLMGAIGEEAITALLTENDKVQVMDVPDALFEIADLKIVNRPWYIDCKNYSDHTLDLFGLTEDDFGYRYKLNGQYFERRAVEKWHDIQAQDGEDSRLIYINIATSQDRPLQYFRCAGQKLERVQRFSEAEVIVVPGALSANNSNTRQETFVHFMQDLEKHL